jgi:hypothetical protein
MVPEGIRKERYSALRVWLVSGEGGGRSEEGWEVYREKQERAGDRADKEVVWRCVYGEEGSAKEMIMMVARLRLRK